MWTVQDQYRNTEDYDFENSRYTQDIPLWVDVCRQAVTSGDSILDIGCGTFREGEVLARLADETGFSLVGVDISSEMLNQAKIKIARLPLQVQHRIHLINGDIVDVLDGLGKFGAIIIPFNGFAHVVGVATRRTILQSIWEHLRLGGIFLADVFVPDVELLAGMRRYHKIIYEEFSITDPHRKETLVRQVSGHYDNTTQLLECMYYYQIYSTVGKGELLRDYCLPFVVQMTFPAEWELLLLQAGFKIEEKWGSYDKTLFGNGSKNMLFLCRKEE